MSFSWKSSWLHLRDRLISLFTRRDASDRRALSVGERGERAAEQFLRHLGYRILAKGFSVKSGEIDIIAVDRRTIVFTEVKAWSRAGQGGPSDAVDERKQKRLTSAALYYLKQNRLLETPSRFDVVQVILDTESGQPEIRHFQGAFEATGNYQMFS